MKNIKFDKPRKFSLIISDDYIELYGIKIEDIHDQDCCEHVYADFSVLENYRKQLEELEEISKLEFKKVKGMGFIIFAEKENDRRVGILINCYNEQNGYYSDELKIKAYDGDKILFEFDSEKQDLIY